MSTSPRTRSVVPASYSAARMSVPLVVVDQCGRPPLSRSSACGSAGRITSRHSSAPLLEPGDDLRAGPVFARALVHAVGDDEHLGHQLDVHLGGRRHARPASPAARIARAAPGGSEALNTALPATRMSTPAAAASPAVSALMPPSISLSHARPWASLSSRTAA